ncbi:MAG: hypothetical protein V7603_5284 [Micromonosporaceae bacterium]
MWFALTQDQEALRDAARDLLARRCPPAVVRAAWPDGDRSTVDDLWRHLVGMGLPAAGVPAERGGPGLDEVAMAALLAEVGYAAVPLPVAETAAVAGPLVGDGTARIALVDASGVVAYAQIADAFLVLHDGPVRLVDRGAVPVAAVSTVDGSLAAGRVSIPDGAGRLVTADPELVALTRERATLAGAAQLIGLSRRMLDLTTGYVSARRQFGVPVGGFQAVAHRLADALLRLEFAAPAVLAAGWALATEPSTAAPPVSMAAVLATEAAREMARTALQCHGAIGHTVEYDLHLFAKRAWALAARVDLDAHLDRLAEALDLKGAGP